MVDVLVEEVAGAARELEEKWEGFGLGEVAILAEVVFEVAA